MRRYTPVRSEILFRRDGEGDCSGSSDPLLRWQLPAFALDTDLPLTSNSQAGTLVLVQHVGLRAPEISKCLVSISNHLYLDNDSTKSDKNTSHSQAGKLAKTVYLETTLPTFQSWRSFRRYCRVQESQDITYQNSHLE